MTRFDELKAMIARDTDECIPWPYSKSKGYGRVYADNATRRAHVVVCEMAHGPKPDGREVAHSCGERSCVNPNHLRWATAAENSADRIAMGRQVRRLTADDVRTIRSLSGALRHHQIADQFGVARCTITQILAGRTWRHVPHDLAA